jgi:CDP-2,3-bis-(O-geranylgeranyl)-sn-glycerol synthase
MAPVIFKKIPFLAQPVSEKYFGKNKTWRGLLVAILFGTFTFYLQQLAYQNGFTSLALIDYNDFSLLLGICMSTGAILGDLIKSYYKRKVDIPAGKPWPIWDQLDFVIGGLIGSMIVYVPSISVVLVLFIFSPLFHILVNLIAYSLKIRETKF